MINIDDQHAPEFWEHSFSEKQLMWGVEPAKSAILAADYFTRAHARDILIPGVGYGRHAKPFLDHGIAVTGIEISETAITLARSRLHLSIPIHHGSVVNMPFDDHLYDGVFCYGLIYLLDAPGRTKLISDCYKQLSPNGTMIFTVITKEAPMYGQGERLGDDWYERIPGVKMYFYDEASVEREFGSHGLVEYSKIDEPTPGGGTFPFFNVFCKKA